MSLILTAFPQAFFSACLYPELFAAVEATEVAQNYEPKNLQVFLAILCVACVGLGQITGAILGGVLTSDKQFSRAYVMVASVLAVFTVTYYCLCGFGTETASVKFEVRGMSSGKRSTGSQK